MNIIKRELKASIRSVIFWSIGIIFIITVSMIKFKAFSGDMAINELLDSMPKGLMEALGMKNMDLASLEGYISTLGLYIYLSLGIHAALLGSSIVLKEERDKTAEYMFSMPLSRRKIITGKIFASLIILALLNLITLGATLISSMSYKRGENFSEFIFLLFLSAFIFQLLFFSIGLFISAINKKYKKSGSLAVGVLMISFLINSLINMVEKVDFLRYITPFKFFEASDILENLKLDPIFLIISIIIIIGGIVGTYIYYPKRDLYI